MNRLLLVAAGGLAAMAFGPTPINAIGLLVVLFSIYRMLRHLESEQNWKAIHAALSDYEEIIGGQLWSGKDAEVLASDRIDDPTRPGPVCFEHICRTKNGAWFLFHVSVSHGRILDRSLSPCDEATAKQKLERHQKAYTRCFGQPEAA